MRRGGCIVLVDRHAQVHTMSTFTENCLHAIKYRNQLWKGSFQRSIGKMPTRILISKVADSINSFAKWALFNWLKWPKMSISLQFISTWNVGSRWACVPIERQQCHCVVKRILSFFLIYRSAYSISLQRFTLVIFQLRCAQQISWRAGSFSIYDILQNR